MLTSRFIHTVAALLMLGGVIEAHAQTATIAGRVVSAAETPGPVIGATVRIDDASRGSIANRDGYFRITGLDPGTYTLTVSSIGYGALDTSVSVVAGDSLFLVLRLEEEEHEAEEVVVTGTRTQRTISDVPVRVEAVPQEEVEEKILMSPSNVSMLLSETAGLRMQTTSPTTSTANLRIQGLPGRYTQVLTDGVPNVGGLSAGTGLTELPPLNLRQVEIIKGAASALYGADAISGVVNFITKDPRPEPELSALVNVTSQKGLDLAAFGGMTFGDVGVTLMVSRNTQPRNDTDGDGFADVPETGRFTLYPKVVMTLSDAMRLDVALGFLSDDRLGGSMAGDRVAGGSDAPYLEAVSSQRLSGTAQWSWDAGDDESVVVKAAAMSLVREARYGTRPFDAAQQFAYAEAQYSAQLGDHDVLLAGIVSADNFEDRTEPSRGSRKLDRGYRYVTPGLLAQEEFRISDAWTALASGRVDFHNRFGAFVTPRASLMFRPSEHVTMRLGGGTGFKAPTIFIEEVEERGFDGVSLADDVDVERAQSASFDVNVRTVIEGSDGLLGLSLNAALFLVRVEKPLELRNVEPHTPYFVVDNADGDLVSRGGEITTKLNVEDFKLSLGYTYMYATQSRLGTTHEIALNPRHAFGGVLMWESEELGAKVGLEAYFTGAQRIDDGQTSRTSPSYWIAGLLAEKAFGPIRLFINFENFTDTRQTHYERIVVGDAATGRVFPKPIWAPLDGRVINGGIRFVL